MKIWIRPFAWIDRVLERLIYFALVGSILTILILSLANIGFRWIDRSFLWIDPMIRHLVFLAAFLGGFLATGTDRHIAIDLLDRYLQHQQKNALRRRLKRLISLLATVILIWLFRAGWNLAVIEWEFGKEVFLTVHSGILVGIIPFGFLLMAYRFFYYFLRSFTQEAA